LEWPKGVGKKYIRWACVRLIPCNICEGMRTTPGRRMLPAGIGPGYSERMGSFKSIYAAVALTLVIPGTRASAQVRPTFPIAYISVQRILKDATDAKAGEKELETLRVSRAQDLNARKKAIEETKLQIANAGGIFSSSKRAQLVQQQARQEAELQQATQQAQTDFNQLQKKIQERLQSELNTVVTALAVQRGVVYVLNQDTSIVLAPTAANWTDEVLQRLNAAAAERAAAGKAGAQKPPTNTP